MRFLKKIAPNSRTWKLTKTSRRFWTQIPY